MKKPAPNPKAKQSSEIALILFSKGSPRPWNYCAYVPHWNYSHGFRTCEEAIKAAFASGFGAVKLPNGKVLAKK